MLQILLVPHSTVWYREDTELVPDNKYVSPIWKRKYTRTLSGLLVTINAKDTLSGNIPSSDWLQWSFMPIFNLFLHWFESEICNFSKVSLTVSPFAGLLTPTLCKLEHSQLSLTVIFSLYSWLESRDINAKSDFSATLPLLMYPAQTTSFSLNYFPWQ